MDGRVGSGVEVRGTKDVKSGALAGAAGDRGRSVVEEWEETENKHRAFWCGE